MKVLVTGATGFVGGWLTTRLVELDHQVRVLVRENSDRSSLSDLPVEYAQGDITNFDSLVSALNGIDCVFHLAGLVGYDVSMRPAMNRINVFGTRNVLNACIQCGIRDLLYMSSVVAIGANTKPTPLTEDSPYDLEHLDMGYFQTKHEAEKLVLEAVKKGHIDAKIVNPSTIYGPSDAKKAVDPPN